MFIFCPFSLYVVGFVPKAHFSSYHSKTFPEICNAALKDFSEDQIDHKQKVENLQATMQMQQLGDLLSPQRKVSHF